ncbi:MAG: hypothetical protein KatS3mg038_0783 [Candidatus Kapaibacterium sp.]|nr:MAG: hypothetical protein KatS3mg038_0783 [Candidatus Kapabacteria bacterium]
MKEALMTTWRQLQDKWRIACATREFAVRAQADAVEVWLYEQIGEDIFGGGISAKTFAREWRSLPKDVPITLRINSPGGDVFDGMAIAEIVREDATRTTVRVDGLAGSIASVIAVAADKRVIAKGGFYFLHDPWAVGIGTAKELRALADGLEQIGDSIVELYHEATGVARREWREMMASETWIDSDRALALGLAHEIVSEQRQQRSQAAAASVDRMMNEILYSRILTASRRRA